MKEIARRSKEAGIKLARLSTGEKNLALETIAKNLEKKKDQIFEANNLDLTEAKKMLQSGLINQSAYNRLKLDENKIRDMISGIRDVIKLEDPVNKILKRTMLDEGLELDKISCPIGVIGVIFESRPDVISQISSLAIKTANAVLLKGGKEAYYTNKMIAKLINNALDSLEFFPKNVINLIFSHEDVSEMLKCEEYIDLIIPRGSNKLVKYIQENTKIPVLGHTSGICHILVDKSADYKKACDIIVDSKTQYPSACNSVETLLIHKGFPKINELKEYLKEKGIEIIENPENWDYEYGEKKLSLKIIDSVQDGIDHINRYGSGHTDCIITEDELQSKIFMDLVDSASVFCNVSTRFADGYRYGLGAEVGISTNKTHARGPVGLEGLVIYKYKLFGQGQIVDDYCKGIKTFKHVNL